MAQYCLTKPLAELFKQKLKSGEINPEKLAAMTSAERHSFFASFLGEDNAKNVNSLFESKLLLKSQKQGMITWAKKVSGISQAVRKDLIAKINSLDRVLNPKEQEQFLHDLASTKLGVDVTQEEAKNIADMSKKIQDTSTPNSDGSRSIEYGRNVQALRRYMTELKQQADGGIKATLKKPTAIPNLTKSLTYVGDFGSFLHQLGATAYSSPINWIKSVSKAMAMAAKQTATSHHVMDEIQAEIISSKNHDRYVKMGLDVGTTSDYLPSNIPEKIPVLGRIYKTTEVGFNGALYLARKNIADNELRIMDEKGIGNDPKQLKAMGSQINNMTGRGSLGNLDRVSGALNIIFSSVRNISSDFHQLTAGLFDKNQTSYSRSVAAKNLGKLVVGAAGTMMLANLIMPGSAEMNPLSTNFGKVKIGNRYYDLPFSGQASIVTLAARLALATVNSFAGTKIPDYITSTGKVETLNLGSYGSTTGLDVFNNFIDNRLSPLFGMFRDAVKGNDMNGQPFNGMSEIGNLIFPLSVQGYLQSSKDPLADKIISAIGNELGAYNYSSSPQAKSLGTGAEAIQLKNKVGQSTFDNLNIKINRQFQSDSKALMNSSQYKNYSDADKQKAITALESAIRSKIYKSVNFHYKEPVNTKIIKRSINRTVKEIMSGSAQ